MRQSSILLSSILWSAPCNNHLSRRAARGMRMAAAPPAMLSDSTPMQTGGGTGPSVYFVMGGCDAWATPPQNPPRFKATEQKREPTKGSPKRNPKWFKVEHTNLHQI